MKLIFLISAACLGAMQEPAATKGPLKALTEALPKTLLISNFADGRDEQAIELSSKGMIIIHKQSLLAGGRLLTARFDWKDVRQVSVDENPPNMGDRKDLVGIHFELKKDAVAVRDEWGQHSNT